MTSIVKALATPKMTLIANMEGVHKREIIIKGIGVI
jgi:hypothetical protein